MERIINGRAEMEEVAKELRRGEDEFYSIKAEKTGKYYQINREKLEAYLSGGSDRKFYEEVETSELQRNPYYVGKQEAVVVDDLDDLGDSEQAPEALVEETAEENSVVEEAVAEDVVAEAVEEVAEEVAETPAQEETKVCECEGKIAELEKELEAKLVEIALKDDEILAKDVHIASLTAELNTLVEIKTEQDAIHQDKVRELEEQISNLLEKLSTPIDYTNAPFETLVDEIAYRGYEVELKYIKK